MNELQIEYFFAFGEFFPERLFGTATREYKDKIIKECLEKNEKYKPDLSDDRLY